MKKNIVLLVEDNLWDAGLVELALAEIEETQFRRIASCSFQMVHVQTMEDAIDVLTEIPVDIVLADLNLPDSQALHSFIRIHTRFPDVPLVVLCGREEEALAVAAVREGAQDYLIKDEVDCVPLARCLYYAIERHRSKNARGTSSPCDPLTGVYTHEQFALLASQSLRLATRLNLAVLVAVAEVEPGSASSDAFARQERDMSLLSAADVLRANFDSSAVIGRLSALRFAVVALFLERSSAEIMSEHLGASVDGHNSCTSRQSKPALLLGVRLFDSVSEAAGESDIEALLSLAMESMSAAESSILTPA